VHPLPALAPGAVGPLLNPQFKHDLRRARWSKLIKESNLKAD